MSPMMWNSKFEFGIMTIDIQHKKLVSLVNDLDGAMSKGHGKEVLGEVLNKLISYTKTHFETEELLMKENGYPGYDEHKKKHTAMASKVGEISREFHAGNTQLTIVVMKYLQGWLNKHILETDKQYVEFLQSKGVN